MGMFAHHNHSRETFTTTEMICVFMITSGEVLPTPAANHHVRVEPKASSPHELLVGTALAWPQYDEELPPDLVVSPYLAGRFGAKQVQMTS